MDRQASKLFLIGDRSLVVPTTVDQVSQEFCPRILDSIESIKAIARSCLKPFPKQLVGIMLQAIRKVNKEICSSKEEKETVIKHLSCVKDSNRLEQVHVLMDDFIMFAHSVQRNVTDQTKKIPFICCQYMNLLNDLESKISNWCDRDSIDYVLNMIRRMMSDATDIVCPQFVKQGSEKEGGKCHRFWKDNHLVVSNTKLTLSMLPPLVDIFTEMGSLEDSN